MKPFIVTAFMTVFNEADILPWTIGHLIEQGVAVYVIDNWSTDDSAKIAQAFPLAGYERFPTDGPSPLYCWRPLLRRVEILAAESSADWCIHHDADEIRRSPRAGEALRNAFWRVDAEGFTAVDHRVFEFQPVDDSYAGDPERHFRYFRTPPIDGRLAHVKAWKNVGRVDLASSAGHRVDFPGLRIFPDKFVLKHYPIRTREQGERKVMRERLPRYDPAERAMNWHVQYDGLAVSQMIRDRNTLECWG